MYFFVLYSAIVNYVKKPHKTNFPRKLRYECLDVAMHRETYNDIHVISLEVM